MQTSCNRAVTPPVPPSIPGTHQSGRRAHPGHHQEGLPGGCSHPAAAGDEAQAGWCWAVSTQGCTHAFLPTSPPCPAQTQAHLLLRLQAAGTRNLLYVVGREPQLLLATIISSPPGREGRGSVSTHCGTPEHSDWRHGGQAAPPSSAFRVCEALQLVRNPQTDPSLEGTHHCMDGDPKV